MTFSIKQAVVTSDSKRFKVSEVWEVNYFSKQRYLSKNFAMMLANDEGCI